MRLAPALLAATLAGCGPSRAPPLTGNLVDGRGAHAGAFRPAGSPNGSGPANAQDVSR